MSKSFETTIIVDKEVPMVRISREFAAEPSAVFRAHTDGDLYAKWVGPRDSTVMIDYYDCRNGGSYRYTIGRPGFEAGFRGCFHEVRPNELIVQTFTFEGFPEGVALEKLRLEPIGNGHTLLTATSLVDSFADRDAFVASGMESGIVEGYRALDGLLAI
ncbi:SRPBCC family protein [soil metagenome]